MISRFQDHAIADSQELGIIPSSNISSLWQLILKHPLTEKLILWPWNPDAGPFVQPDACVFFAPKE